MEMVAVRREGAGWDETGGGWVARWMEGGDGARWVGVKM